MTWGALVAAAFGGLAYFWFWPGELLWAVAAGVAGLSVEVLFALVRGIRNELGAARAEARWRRETGLEGAPRSDIEWVLPESVREELALRIRQTAAWTRRQGVSSDPQTCFRTPELRPQGFGYLEEDWRIAWDNPELLVRTADEAASKRAGAIAARHLPLPSLEQALRAGRVLGHHQPHCTLDTLPNGKTLLFDEHDRLGWDAWVYALSYQYAPSVRPASVESYPFLLFYVPNEWTKEADVPTTVACLVWVDPSQLGLSVEEAHSPPLSRGAGDGAPS